MAKEFAWIERPTGDRGFAIVEITDSADRIQRPFRFHIIRADERAGLVFSLNGKWYGRLNVAGIEYATRGNTCAKIREIFERQGALESAAKAAEQVKPPRAADRAGCAEARQAAGTGPGGPGGPST